MSVLAWAFGGVGGAVVVAAAGWFIFDRRNSDAKQSQRSGSNSRNYQAGRDLSIRDIEEKP
ncbi:hypothetical protein ACFZC6_45470 [Streptomyces ossamyceticus]|uniref:Secreted protein with PEP-CTERM sorting signal n=1 Tax=Streptomyces ossamyceticus TaxID=249581 RepID=A0ABV2UVQ7_9ACTN